MALSGEVNKGAKLGDVVLGAMAEAGCRAEDGDVLVVTHKIVSKAEGRVVEIDGNEAKAAVVEGEAAMILRRRNGLIIAQTRHGLVCANAGVDSSNVAPGHLVLLPADPDASARRIRQRIKAKTGRSLGVVVSDTFGRPWRVGQTNIAIGVAGFMPLTSYIGTEDTFGNRLKATSIAIADELAAAAEIVMGKSEGIPLALIRGAPIRQGRGSAAQLIRRPAEDLFR
ncbi:MAG: coenzyme F420-0:L-glutamate ligase [Actinomycetota bacterium]